MTGLRTLTVWQPDAEAIMAGAKTVENRTWSTAHRGLLLIHAGLKARPGVNGLPRGALLGSVELVAVHEDTRGKVRVENMELDSQCCQRHTGALTRWQFDGGDGPMWHWELAHPVRFATPVPCAGRQRLWSPPAGVFGEIREALVGTVRGT